MVSYLESDRKSGAMETVLITGATGFIGSSLAASLLGRGMSVLCLTRNDPSGSKTKLAIERASQTLGLSLGKETLAHLKVISGSIEDIESCLNCDALKE